MAGFIDDEKEETPGSLAAGYPPQGGTNIYEQMLRQQLANGPQAAPQGIDLGQLGAALSKSANQLGAVGGKVADSSGLKDYADTLTNFKKQQQADLLAQNTKRQDLLGKLAMLKDAQANKEGLVASNAQAKEDQRAFDLQSQNRKFSQEKELLGLKNQAEKDRDAQKLASKMDENGNPLAKPATADERTSAMFATRAKDAAELAKNIEGSGYNPASYGASLRTTSLPFVGMVGANSDDRSYNQARRSFISAVLRKESGAAISDKEYENEAKKYFPEPGDGPQQIAQKDAERQRAIQTLIAASGSAYSPANQQPFDYHPESVSTRGSSGLQAAEPPKDQAKGPKVGDVVKGYQFNGGDPADKNNWKKVQ